jgi:hypothetical protein
MLAKAAANLPVRACLHWGGTQLLQQTSIISPP